MEAQNRGAPVFEIPFHGWGRVAQKSKVGGPCDVRPDLGFPPRNAARCESVSCPLRRAAVSEHRDAFASERARILPGWKPAYSPLATPARSQFSPEGRVTGNRVEVSCSSSFQRGTRSRRWGAEIASSVRARKTAFAPLPFFTPKTGASNGCARANFVLDSHCGAAIISRNPEWVLQVRQMTEAMISYMSYKVMSTLQGVFTVNNIYIVPVCETPLHTRRILASAIPRHQAQ